MRIAVRRSLLHMSNWPAGLERAILCCAAEPSGPPPPQQACHNRYLNPLYPDLLAVPICCTHRHDAWDVGRGTTSLGNTSHSFLSPPRGSSVLDEHATWLLGPSASQNRQHLAVTDPDDAVASAKVLPPPPAICSRAAVQPYRRSKAMLHVSAVHPVGLSSGPADTPCHTRCERERAFPSWPHTC